MAIFTQESLDNLRQRIDLVDVLSSHIELKAAGSTYKALCPFHDEKSPSFSVGKGESHYHCFGCGAHGDAIQFLMNHLNMRFFEAVETLAQRFNVHLERVEGGPEEKGSNKKAIKDALQAACRFFHFMLLHTEEGHEALAYLYKRGIDLDFVRRFEIGLAPKAPGIFRRTLMSQGFNEEILTEAGLVVQREGRKANDFFYDRITFPICDGTGTVIGFSARKYKEDTFGGKYVNTPETPVFKKSRILFGLHHCRKRIAKERRVIIVEGQVDALRMIDSGLNLTVASQGTAFGEGHVSELVGLGVEQVFIAFDADEAGQKAAAKVGDLFQRRGIAVAVVRLPAGQDPDSFLREQGPNKFLELLKNADDYLTFLVSHLSREHNVDTPAGKNLLVEKAVQQIRGWDNALMVHESLRRLAQLVHVPEELIGSAQAMTANVLIKRTASIGVTSIDTDRILEVDLLRWLVLHGAGFPQFAEEARRQLNETHFRSPHCYRLFRAYLDAKTVGKSCDLLSLAAHFDQQEGQALADELLGKKINLERAEQHFPETIQKLLDRRWMEQCEEVRLKLNSGQCTDDEALELVKLYNDLRKSRGTQLSTPSR